MSNLETRPFWSVVNLVRDSEVIGSPSILLEDMDSGTGSLNKNIENDDSEKMGRPFLAGDILFGKLRPYLRKSWHATCDGVAVGDIHIYRSHGSSDPRFLSYVVQSIDFAEFAEKHSYGTKMPRCEWSSLVSYQIVDFPLETQQRIADYLDRETAEIDAAVADLDRYVELLEKRRRVVIANAVTGRDQPTLKDSGSYWLGEVAIDWDVMPAWLVMRERSEKNLPDDVHLTPSQTYGVVTQKQYMEITGNKVTLNLSGADNMKRVYPGDFIIHLRSFQGGIEASTIGGKVSNAYTVLKPTSVANFDYYRWFMKSQTLIEGLASSTDQLRDGQSINFSRFSRLPLPVPPLSEQVRIADYLDRETAEIDSLITDSNHLRDLLIKRRSVLIADVVTGRKQV